PSHLLIGSRFLGAGAFRSTKLRRVGIGIIAAVVRLLFGVRITDPTSGMRLMDRRAMTLFARNYPKDYPEPISLAGAARHGLAVREIPVTMRAREHGKSSIAGLKTLSYMVRVVAYLVLAKLGGRG